MRLIAAVSMAVLLAATTPVVGQEPGYKVIVHPSNTGTIIKKPTLSGIFMGKVQRWGDSSLIVPVDQSAQSAVRAKFVKDVMNQSVAAVMAYWARQMMSGGARPPVVKPTDREVIDHVVKTPGAIGYVAAETTLPATVKVLTVE